MSWVLSSLGEWNLGNMTENVSAEGQKNVNAGVVKIIVYIDEKMSLKATEHNKILKILQAGFD